MEHTVEKLSGNKVKISFKAPAASFDDALQKAYLKMRGQISVPGFRKGKAPRRLIESMYGNTVFYDDALELLFPEAYMTAVQENNLQPVGRPEVDVQEMGAGQELAFSCEVFVTPDVALGEYKGLSVTREIRKVGAEEIDSQIAQEQKRVSRSVDVTERPLENGDKAELDYSGSVDGEKFDGGTAEHQSLVIGSGSFIPGFEEQMIGMTIGEERDLNVQFPEEYHAEELKGKTAVFHVKLHAISREELPELDDDFASEISDFDTMAEYRADLEKKLQEAADAQSDEAAKQVMLETIVNNATVDVPPPMVEEKLDDMMQQMSWRMQRQGIGMEQYLSIIGQTEQQMRDMYRTEALGNVKTELVINQIIKTEEVQADDADMDHLLEGYTSSMNQSLEQLKAGFNASQLDFFRHRACINKALDMLWASAKIMDEEASSDDSEDGQKGSSESASLKDTGESDDSESTRRAVKKAAEGDAEEAAEKKTPAKRTRKKADAQTSAEA